MFAFVLLGAASGLAFAFALHALGAALWLAMLAYLAGSWISLGIFVAMTYERTPER